MSLKEERMKTNLKKMAGYYKPYMGIFLLDMFFAFLASAIALIIPLPVRYITKSISTIDVDSAVKLITTIGIALILLVIVQFFANYFISYVGHMMGAKWNTICEQNCLPIIRSYPSPSMMSKKSAD